MVPEKQAKPLTRDIQALSSRHFDVLVIGGGIVGACIAREAILAGLSVALVERDDFGGATSSGCFKIIHGGLRYLQRLDFGHLRESMREQWAFRKIAPHLVKPQGFIIPCYGRGKRGKALMQTALAAYELLTLDRNWAIGESHRLPRHGSLTAEETLQIAPGLNPHGLRGAVLFYDCQIHNCEQLTFAFVADAATRGASVANYVRVNGFEAQRHPDNSRNLTAVKCADLSSGKNFSISSRFVVNAAGPWIGEVLRNVDAKLIDTLPHRSLFSKGVQLIFPSLISSPYGVAVESAYGSEEKVISRGGRSYFIVPWRNTSLVGTADFNFLEQPDNYRILPKEIETFVTELKSLYQSPLITKENVRFAFGGVRPVSKCSADSYLKGTNAADDTLEVELKDRILDHALSADPGQRVENLISTIGVKYTTARAVAVQAVRLLAKKAKTSLPHFDSSQIPLATRPLLAAKGDCLDGTTMMRAEILTVIRDEMVLKLSDVIFRRTDLGTAGNPGQSVLSEVARLLTDELGWDEARRQSELQETTNLFQF